MTLRFLTGGESHGRALVVIVEGLPSSLEVDVDAIAAELARRRLGFGRGPRQRFERDELVLLGGVRHGVTLGSPLVIEIPNLEWPKWEAEMSPGPGTTAAPLTAPRPGHADLAGMQKYGFDDAPQRVGACVRPRDGRSRRRGRRGEAAHCPDRDRGRVPRGPDGLGAFRQRSAADRGRSRHDRCVTRCAASTRRPKEPWWRR